jgi:hypothetical protein
MRVHLRFILITLGVIGLVTVLALELGDVPVSSQTAGPSGRLLPSNWFLRVCGDFRQFSFRLLVRWFLSAATDLPFAEESFTIRWLFLGVGTLAGSAIWIRSNRLNTLECRSYDAALLVLPLCGCLSPGEERGALRSSLHY